MRTRVRFRCLECGATSPKWLGRCPECGEWSSLVEEVEARGRATTPEGAVTATPVPLADVDPLAAPRRATGVAELDRVLGGGLVPGSVTLLGGEPGMGKSTLLLQALGEMAAAGATCLLVSAEESAEQVRLRAARLGALDPKLLVVTEMTLPVVLATIETTLPHVVAIDSVQALHDPDLPGGPGSVGQVRHVAARLVQVAKRNGIASFLVGHVTKEGALAGPRVLEHLVDTVCSFEGDRHHALRLLRAVKHRFGATDELGLFEMTVGGLRGVPDASALLLADRRVGASGSAVAPVLDGARPMLVEVQALVAPTPAPVPRRTALALDGGRLALLLAVLHRRAGISMVDADVYASVAGGIRVAEPGADLAVAMALVSAWADWALPPNTVMLGEVGLGGEIRQVSQAPRRLAEAVRAGFTDAVVPLSTPEVAGLRLHRFGDLPSILDALGPGAV